MCTLPSTTGSPYMWVRKPCTTFCRTCHPLLVWSHANIDGATPLSSTVGSRRHIVSTRDIAPWWAHCGAQDRPLEWFASTTLPIARSSVAMAHTSLLPPCGPRASWLGIFASEDLQRVQVRGAIVHCITAHPGGQNTIYRGAGHSNGCYASYKGEWTATVQ